MVPETTVKSFVQILTAGAVVAGSATVAAQPTAESGVKLGDKSRLHAKLDLSTIYDTNAFRQNDDENVSDNWRLLINPGLLLDIPGNSFALQWRGDMSITQFLDDIPPDAGESTRVGGSTGLRLRAGSEKSTVGFTLANSLTRTPVYLSEPSAITADEVRFPQWLNRGEARVIVRPGGRALELDFGYRNFVSIYDELPDSHSHLGLFEARWKFLPKTMVLFTTDFGYFANEGAREGNDATPLNIQVGLIGQLTARLSTDLRVGYGNSLVWDNDELFGTTAEGSQDTPTVSAFLTYQAGDRLAITGGYERTVTPLILFDSFINDAFRLSASLGIDRFVGRVFGSYSLRNYGLNERFAEVGLVGVSLDYYVLKFLVVGAQYRLTVQGSDDDEQDQADIGTPENPFVGDFTRHQVVFTVGIEY